MQKSTDRLEGKRKEKIGKWKVEEGVRFLQVEITLSGVLCAHVSLTLFIPDSPLVVWSIFY